VKRYLLAFPDRNGKSFWAEPEVRATEGVARQELVLLLRAVEQTQLSVSPKTRRPTGAAVRKIAGMLVGGDFHDSDKYQEKDGKPGAIRAFAWPLLLQGGKLTKINGNKLELTRSGRKALTAPPHETLRTTIWKGGQKGKLIDEFNRIHEIKGQYRKGPRHMTPVSERRNENDISCVCCLNTLPHSA